MKKPKPVERWSCCYFPASEGKLAKPASKRRGWSAFCLHCCKRHWVTTPRQQEKFDKIMLFRHLASSWGHKISEGGYFTVINRILFVFWEKANGFWSMAKISFIFIAERKSLLPRFPGCHWKNLQSAVERVQEGNQTVWRGLQVRGKDVKDL